MSMVYATAIKNLIVAQMTEYTADTVGIGIMGYDSAYRAAIAATSSKFCVIYSLGGEDITPDAFGKNNFNWQYLVTFFVLADISTDLDTIVMGVASDFVTMMSTPVHRQAIDATGAAKLTSMLPIDSTIRIDDYVFVPIGFIIHVRATAP